MSNLFTMIIEKTKANADTVLSKRVILGMVLFFALSLMLSGGIGYILGHNSNITPILIEQISGN